MSMDERAGGGARALVGAWESETPRVLVVEDNMHVRAAIVTFLSYKGIQVTEAADGREGLERARSGGVDLIVMDWDMPRLDGLAASRAIRSLPGPVAEVPIVAYTSRDLPEEIDACLAAGMRRHVSKNGDPELLVEAIRAELGDLRGGSAGRAA